MYDKNQDMLQQCINTYNLIGKVSHPSRTMSSYAKKWVYQQTDSLPKKFTIMQRIYHILHNMVDIPICRFCNIKPLSWDLRALQYRNSCGPKCANQDPNVLQKRRDTMLEVYGVEHIRQRQDFMDKYNQTIKAKYGVDNISQLESIKQKKRDTTFENFGVEYPMQSQQVRQKLIDTNIERYGHQNVLASQYGQDLARKSCMERFGRLHPNQSHISDDVYLKLNDKQWMCNQHIDQEQTICHIARMLDVDFTTVIKYMNLHQIETKKFYRSMDEKEIGDYVKSLGVDIILRDTTIIKPKELDIVIPSCNLAIEYCGVFYHSEKMGKDNMYHYNKYIGALKSQYTLLTIFSDVWEKHKLRILDYIKFKVLYDTLPNPHNYTICQISNQQTLDFYNLYSFSNFDIGDINYGLFEEGVLISCISLNGDQIINYCCNNLYKDCLTIMLSYLQQLYNKLSVVIDLCWNNGLCYIDNGFMLECYQPAICWYSKNGHDRVTLEQIQQQYHIDKDLYQDNNIWKVYDCGYDHLVWSK